MDEASASRHDVSHDLIQHCVPCLVRVEGPLGRTKRRTREPPSREEEKRDQLSYLVQTFHPSGIWGTCGPLPPGSRELSCRKCWQPRAQSIPRGNWQAGGSTEVTAWSPALGWVPRGLGAAELRRNGIEAALPTELWAGPNIIRMPQTQSPSRLLLG